MGARFREGYWAFIGGYKLLDCPWPVLSPEWHRWRAGWLGAQGIDREARRMGLGGKG